MPESKGISMASIQARTRTDGTPSYRVQYRINGKLTSKSFANIKGAQEFAAQVDRSGPEAALAIWTTRQGRNLAVPLFREWANTYLDEASGYLTGIQTGTREGYRQILKVSLNPILGDIPVDAITKSDIGRWIAWQEAQKSKRRKDQNVSAKTVKNYHALLSAILTGAIEAKHRTDNPARGMRLSRGVKHEPVFLTQAEFFTLHYFIADYYKPLVSFLVASGCRWSEATALEKRDVNTDATPPTVRVTKAWKKDNTVGPPKSDRGRRTISLWTGLVNQLDLDGPGSKLLFQGMQNGGRVWYGNFKLRVWDRAVEAANDPQKCKEAKLQPLGKRPTPHDLRHSHASWQIAAGTNLTSLQVRMGHEKITTTSDIYGHLMPDAHIQMSNVMEAAMSHVIPELTA